MQNLMTKLRALAEFIIGFCLGYCAFFFPFNNIVVNLVLIIIAIFVLMEGLGTVDEMNGYGQSPDKDKHRHHED